MPAAWRAQQGQERMDSGARRRLCGCRARQWMGEGDHSVWSATMKAGRVSTTGGPTPHSQHLVVFVLLGPRGSPRQGPHSGTPQKLAGMLLAVLGLALGQWDSPTPRKPPSPHNFQITWPFKKNLPEPIQTLAFSLASLSCVSRTKTLLISLASHRHLLILSGSQQHFLPFPFTLQCTLIVVIVVVNSVQSQDRIQEEFQRQGVKGIFQGYALNIVRGCQDAVWLWVS